MQVHITTELVVTYITTQPVVTCLHYNWSSCHIHYNWASCQVAAVANNVTMLNTNHLTLFALSHSLKQFASAARPTFHQDAQIWCIIITNQPTSSKLKVNLCTMHRCVDGFCSQWFSWPSLTVCMSGIRWPALFLWSHDHRFTTYIMLSAYCV